MIVHFAVDANFMDIKVTLTLMYNSRVMVNFHIPTLQRH